MKRLMFALVMMFFVGTGAAQVKYVAVVETEVDAQSGAATKLNKAEVRQITTVLRNEARNNLPSGKYKIMTAETVIAQGSAKLEECAEENCVITLGSKIGADYIVRGIISKFGTKLTMSVEVYETEDGTLVASSRVSSEKAEELLEKVTTACAEMYRKFENPQNSTQKTLPPQPAVTSQQQSYQPSTPANVPAPAPAPSPQPINYGSLRDSRDGKTYKTAVIGGKRWMAENLNYLPQSGQSWCYNKDDSYCGKYGRLYDWNTAITICPAGWHLPSREEWNNLVTMSGGSSAAGKKLKAGSGWNPYKGKTGNGTDDYGFSALPGGSRHPAGGGFFAVGYHGNWWTTADPNSAYYRGAYYDNDGIREINTVKGFGFSVRCVQD